jgi:hypothetical protein
MSALLAITDWPEYEFGDFKRLKNRAWYPKRIAHDGLKYKTIMRAERGHEVYLAFTLLEQIAAKSSTPGVICDSKGNALTPNDLYIITECPAEVFAYAIPKLLEVGWMKDLNGTPENAGKNPGNSEIAGKNPPTDRTDKTDIPVSQTTAKAAKKSNDTTNDDRPNIGSIFVNAYKKLRRGTDYVMDGADKGALKRLNEVFKPGETKLCKQIVEAYLYDPDSWLSSRGWKLQYLPERVPKYRQKIQLSQKQTPTEESEHDKAQEQDPFALAFGGNDKQSTERQPAV